MQHITKWLTFGGVLNRQFKPNNILRKELILWLSTMVTDMLKLFRAIKDVKQALYVEGNDDYNQGVNDAMEAVLRSLGYYKQFIQVEKENNK